MAQTDLSVIIPVYNSAEIFPELYKRLTKVLSKIGKPYEIIAVVDGCSDKSAEVIQMYCKSDADLKMIEFSRNFGHQAAITAGLQFSSGANVIVMDDDLEDEPEILPRFLEKASQGYDVVYGVRKKRKVSVLRRLSFHTFYRLLNFLSEINMPLDSGDFCLMKRPVVDALNAMPETNRYIRGLRSWLGFEQVGLEYERSNRSKGSSGYSLRKYIRLAMDAIFSFSYKPLKYVSYLGSAVAFISFVLGLRLIFLAVLDRSAEVPGWASLMVVSLFIGGVQLLSIGILGQFLARTYDESKNRPKFVIRRAINFSGGSINE